MKIASREKRQHAACRLFSRGLIFTRARVSPALLSLHEEKWGTTRSLSTNSCYGCKPALLQVLAIGVMHVETLKDVKKGNILRSTVNLFKILMGFH